MIFNMNKTPIYLILSPVHWKCRCTIKTYSLILNTKEWHGAGILGTQDNPLSLCCGSHTQCLSWKTSGWSWVLVAFPPPFSLSVMFGPSLRKSSFFLFLFLSLLIYLLYIIKVQKILELTFVIKKQMSISFGVMHSGEGSKIKSE